MSGAKVLQINRALSVKRDLASGAFHVGTTPAIAKTIQDPPAFLADLMLAFANAAPVERAIGRLVQRYGADQLDDIIGATSDLLQLGVLCPVGNGVPRHDRHHLYFRLYGVDEETYDTTVQNLRVGVVGMGGLGSTVSLLLAAAGVGHLVVSDGDRLEESNMTRSILYREGDIARKKVEAAEAQIAGVNSSTVVSTVDAAFDGPDLIEERFGDCDVIVLTADNPAGVHDWIDGTARRLGIPYVTAGYLETQASVGPFVVPGTSACYECYKMGRDALETEELNSRLQAASYGPLNVLSSSIAANEVLRYALGLAPTTLNRISLTDIAKLEIQSLTVEPHPDCDCGAYMPSDSKVGRVDDPFCVISQNYAEERENTSLNRVLLDQILASRIHPGCRVLDLGAGIGTLSRAAADKACDVVAVERSPDMLQIFRDRMSLEQARRITIYETDLNSGELPDGTFHTILLVLILDHLAEPQDLLRLCRTVLAPGGRIQVVVPHPFKDSGSWRSAAHGEPRWVLRDYFFEGKQKKSRFDSKGNELPVKPVTWKRTLSGWMSFLSEAGLAVIRIDEPRPKDQRAHLTPQLARAREVPYFLVLECIESPAKKDA